MINDNKKNVIEKLIICEINLREQRPALQSIKKS